MVDNFSKSNGLCMLLSIKVKTKAIKIGINNATKNAKM